MSREQSRERLKSPEPEPEPEPINKKQVVRKSNQKTIEQQVAENIEDTLKKNLSKSCL
jgi:hypothetical protein